MIPFFLFIIGIVIISSTRTYQLAIRPELTESEGLREFWWAYLIAVAFIFAAAVIQSIRDETNLFNER